MNNSKSELFNKIFNAFVLIGMTVATIIATGIKLGAAESGRALLIVAAAGSLCGVLANVLSANGRLLTFLFGLIDVTIYGVVCLFDTKYGNAALHLLYFLPMQVVGFVQWKKRGASEGHQVQARRLDGRKWLLYGGIFLVGLVVAYYVLCALDKTEAAEVIRWVVLMDALSMMCNILLRTYLSGEIQFLSGEFPQRIADLDRAEPSGCPWRRSGVNICKFENFFVTLRGFSRGEK